MGTATTSIRTDARLEQEADQLSANLGMNSSTAVNVFPHQAAREQGLPSRTIRDVPNAETIAAMREADRIAADPEAQGFASVDELFADLNA